MDFFLSRFYYNFRLKLTGREPYSSVNRYLDPPYVFSSCKVSCCIPERETRRMPPSTFMAFLFQESNLEFSHTEENMYVWLYCGCKTRYTIYIQGYIAFTGWPRSYRKYILQITQTSQYRYAKLQYRFSVTSGSPSICRGGGVLVN